MKYTIGIDIGGTKIQGIVWDGGNIVEELTIVTPRTRFEFQRNLSKLVDFLSAKQKISKIGIGMAGVIDTKRLVAVYSPNIRYIKDFSFKEMFGRTKLAVGNDAKSFALAEGLLGEGKGFNSVVGVILGTGMGSGWISGGKIFTGQHFGAGEFGQMVYSGKETFEQAFQKFRDARNDRALAEVVGRFLAGIYHAYDPDLIVLGGGVALDKKRKFLGPAKTICAGLLSPYGIKPRIEVSKLKNAGAIGAALLAK